MKTPPAFILWDIENCTIPPEVTVHSVVTQVRSRVGGTQITIKCFRSGQCRLGKPALKSLENCGVEVIATESLKPEAADKEMLREIYSLKEKPPTRIVIISGDSDFSKEVAKLRYQLNFEVILFHDHNTREDYKAQANRCINWQDMISEIPIIISPSITTTNPHKKENICQYFLSGNCRFGSSCNNLHQTKPNDSSVTEPGVFQTTLSEIEFKFIQKYRLEELSKISLELDGKLRFEGPTLTWRGSPSNCSKFKSSFNFFLQKQKISPINLSFPFFLKTMVVPRVQSLAEKLDNETALMMIVDYNVTKKDEINVELVFLEEEVEKKRIESIEHEFQACKDVLNETFQAKLGKTFKPTEVKSLLQSVGFE
eukprot:Lithocolla_globosa_v1_NODE_63_length_7262_cov_10.450950.p2 type:complete len:369 gc:universal NODE_63_length_7262_cov_10.450950:499-1605(+)